MLDFKFCVEICADRFLANLRLRRYALVVPSLVGLIANVQGQKEFQRAIGLVSTLVDGQASQLRFSECISQDTALRLNTTPVDG